MAEATQPIVMYARTRFCPDVTRARTRLSELSLTWEEFDIEADPEAKARMVAMTGRPNVPTVIIGKQILVEPSVQAIDDALEAAGYSIPVLLGEAE